MTTEQKHIKFKNKIENSISVYNMVLQDALKAKETNKIEDLNDFYEGQVKLYRGKKETAQELKEYYEYLFE